MRSHKPVDPVQQGTNGHMAPVGPNDDPRSLAVRRRDFEHSLGSRASRAVGTDQLHSTLKLAWRNFRECASSIRRGPEFNTVAGHPLATSDPASAKSAALIVNHKRLGGLTQGMFFLLHVPSAFVQTIRSMSNPSVKIIFLLLIFLANPLRADEVVRAAQKKLAALGYYKARVDGSPGSMTSAAVRRFQLAENLKVTGSLNRQTLQALGVGGSAPIPEYNEIRSLFQGGPLADAESEIQVAAIRTAQAKLAEAGLYAGPHNGLPCSALADAIREWQLAQDLPQTGKLDARTVAGLGIPHR